MRRTASYYEELEKWKLVTKLSSLQSSSVSGSKAHEKSDLPAAENQRARTGTQGRVVEVWGISERRESSAGGRLGKSAQKFSKVIY